MSAFIWPLSGIEYFITLLDYINVSGFSLLQKKCEMYWPEDVGTSAEYGDITVSLEQVERFGDYIQRTMKIRHSVNISNIHY